jgi:hypothetical protein
VVAATAGLLAVSPLAFAGDEGNNNIVPIQGNTLQVNPQVCGNQVASGLGVGVLIAKATGEADNDSKCKQRNDIDNDIDN